MTLLSKLGLGTVKFGRNTSVKYPGGDGFSLPTDHEIDSLLDLCLDHGITLLDTAPAYGTAEERLGQRLGTRRKKFFLVTKTGEEFDGTSSQYIFTASHTRMSIERSLTRLKTDYLDAVLVHASRTDVDVIDKTDVIDTLGLLKAEGKIGMIGVSTYTVDGGLRALARTDAAMVTYNAADTSQVPVIAAAHGAGKKIFVKKGLASGHVETLGDPAANVRFVTRTPGVTTLVFGSLSPRNILYNINALSNT